MPGIRDFTAIVAPLQRWALTHGVKALIIVASAFLAARAARLAIGQFQRTLARRHGDHDFEWQRRVATLSGHHSPQTLLPDLMKYKRPQDLPTLLYHIKPAFQATVEKQCAKLKGLNLSVLSLGDQLLL